MSYHEIGILKCVHMTELQLWSTSVAHATLMDFQFLRGQILIATSIFPTIEKTGRKLSCIREQIIGIVMASECDFENVTCIWSCNLHAL